MNFAAACENLQLPALRFYANTSKFAGNIQTMLPLWRRQTSRRRGCRRQVKSARSTVIARTPRRRGGECFSDDPPLHGARSVYPLNSQMRCINADNFCDGLVISVPGF